MTRRVLALLLLATAARAETYEAVFTLVPNATGYRLEVRVPPTPWPVAGPDLAVTPTPGPGRVGVRFVYAVDTDIEARVRALRGSDESPPSNVIAARPRTRTSTPSHTPTRTPTRSATPTQTLPPQVPATPTVGVPTFTSFGVSP